jgi:multiple sugar transport system substrate-binding protein
MYRMIRQIGLTLLLLAAIGILLPGCSDRKFINGPLADLVPTGPVQEEVVFWHTYSDEETRVFENELLPLFAEQHPNIHITAVRQPYTELLKTAIISRATSGRAPDVVRMDFIWVPQFIELGLLYPLSSLPDFPAIKADMRSDVLQTAYGNNAYYGLPLNMSTKIAIYNRELLHKAGYDKPPSTLKEMVELSRKNGYTFAFGEFSSWGFLPYFLGFGGQVLSPDWSHADGFINSQASVQAVKTMLALYEEGILGVSSLSERMDLWENVRSGKLLMIDEGPWYYSIYLNTKSVGEEVLRQTVPAPFPGSGGSVVGGEDLVILKNTAHLEAAWTFTKWLAAPEAQERMFRVGLLPTNVRTPIPAELGNSSYIEATMHGLDNAFLRPAVPEWDQIDDIISKTLPLIFTRAVSPEQGLDDAAKTIDGLLAK